MAQSQTPGADPPGLVAATAETTEKTSSGGSADGAVRRSNTGAKNRRQKARLSSHMVRSVNRRLRSAARRHTQLNASTYHYSHPRHKHPRPPSSVSREGRFHIPSGGAVKAVCTWVGMRCGQHRRVQFSPLPPARAADGGGQVEGFGEGLIDLLCGTDARVCGFAAYRPTWRWVDL